MELTGWLSNFGRIECASVTELVLLNDVAESSGANCGTSNEKVIGAGLNGLPPLLLVRNNPNRGSSFPVFGNGIALVETRSRRTDQCIKFLPSVSVENGRIENWNFPANWKIHSDYFEAKHATTGDFVSITAGQIGPAILTGGPVQMQAKNIDTLTTTAGGVYADIVAETIDSASGTGINALQGLSGSITADSVADGSQIKFSNPAGLNGVAAGSTIRLKSLPAGAVIDLPANGLQGQIILNAANDIAPGDAWGGQIKVNGVEIAHSGAQYTPLTVSTAAHGGGSVGLVRYERHNADCSPLDGGLRTLGDFFSGSHPVVIEYYGPVKDNDTLVATPPVKIEWTDTHNTTYDLTDPDQYTNIGGQVFSVSLSGRKVVITPHAGRQIWGFPLGTFTVTPRAGRLACDQLNGISPDVDSAAYSFIIQPACAGGNTPGMVTDCDGDEIIDLCETADPPSCGTCRADVNNDGEVNPDDLGDFINLYFLQGTDRYGPGFYAVVGYWPNFFGWKADFNQDGDLDPDDLGDYINAYFGAGCG